MRRKVYAGEVVSERQSGKRRPAEKAPPGARGGEERTVHEERELAIALTRVRLFRWTEDRLWHTAARLRLRLRLPACRLWNPPSAGRRGRR